MTSDAVPGAADELPDDVVRKLVRGNAIELLQLDFEP